MKRIQLTGTDFNDIIIISKELDGTILLNGGCSFSKFDNEYGNGTITSIRVSDEISALIFDVVFHVDIEFVYSNPAKECMDLLFCLEGSVLHRMNQENEFEKINFRQNTLVKRPKSSLNSISFLPHQSLKMSFISYSIADAAEFGVQEYQNLREMAFNSLKKLDTIKDYRYLGRICFRTSSYVQEIMPFTFENASDILFKEAAILNTLASQLDRYEKDLTSEYSDAPIKQYELDKILAIEVFVQKNLAENLSINNLVSISGLGAATLQLGFTYLYNTTVNKYITQKRLEKAAELLPKNELNISEIVYHVGFSSRSYFSKIFKERYGISPSVALHQSKSN